VLHHTRPILPLTFSGSLRALHDEPQSLDTGGFLGHQGNVHVNRHWSDR